MAPDALLSKIAYLITSKDSKTQVLIGRSLMSNHKRPFITNICPSKFTGNWNLFDIYKSPVRSAIKSGLVFVTSNSSFPICGSAIFWSDHKRDLTKNSNVSHKNSSDLFCCQHTDIKSSEMLVLPSVIDAHEHVSNITKVFV